MPVMETQVCHGEILMIGDAKVTVMGPRHARLRLRIEAPLAVKIRKGIDNPADRVPVPAPQNFS